ncbi:MAG: hypothetical protein ABI347_09985 [Nitrososphaera sp.]
MPSTRLVIDIVFIILVVVAVSITAITLAKIITDSFHTYDSAMQTAESKMVITDPGFQ